MRDKPAIPRSVFERIQDFLKDHKTGQIKLHIHQGHVSGCAIKEEFRVTDDPSEPDVPARASRK